MRLCNALRAICGLATAGALSSCTGYVLSPSEEASNRGSDPSVSDCVPGDATCEAPTALALAPIRRLSETEYHNTMSDLFDGVTYTPTDLVPTLTARGFENFVSNTRAVGARDVDAFNDAVDSIAARASTDRTFLAQHGCADPEQAAACIDNFIRQFGLRSFRRPLTDDEVTAYRNLIEETTTAIDLAAGIETMIASTLMSPELVYRVEQTGQEQAGPYEVASRLSYLIWQSMPDDVLLEAAADDALSTPAQREAQARRMLADPRAAEAMADFFRQWFRFSRMDEDKYAAKSPTLFPEWTPALRASVHDEMRRFVRHIADTDTTLARLYTDRTAYLDAEMASHYGIATGEEGAAIELPAGQRAGILTRANFLAGTGIAGHGSPVHRGVFVYESLLCHHLGGVPDDVDTSLPPTTPADQTNRELYAEITSPAACRGCHSLINPIGFTFEHYTSTGAFRALDNGRPVDASGALAGSDQADPIDGAVALSAQLAQSRTAHDCAADTWVAYMLGRRLDPRSEDDTRFADRMQRAFWQNGGNMRELLVHFVTQPEFVRGAQ